MSLTHLDVTDFRNLGSIALKPLPYGFNFLYGYNGSGKTSLLEAIHYLTLGRSFRNNVIGRVIRNGTDKFVIFAQAMAASEQIISLGVERHTEGDIKIRLNGQDIQSISQLADLTPVRLINSHCYNLLDGGPHFRRKYMDWGVFYLNKEFLKIWRDYGQILKQRNACLRNQLPPAEIRVWTEKLIQQAAILHNLRFEYVQQLLPVLREAAGELIDLPKLEVVYYPGWEAKSSLEAALGQSLPRDLQLGYTQYGPHRADLKVKINKVLAKDILSRGQQKLFVCAMILAQGTLLNSVANKRPIYLIDDLPAELDIVSRTNLIALLSKQKTQVFVTAVERHALCDALSMLPLKMFHVEHGSITEVS
jgi:DNA replication and repair protein RecF